MLLNVLPSKLPCHIRLHGQDRRADVWIISSDGLAGRTIWGRGFRKGADVWIISSDGLAGRTVWGRGFEERSRCLDN